MRSQQISAVGGGGGGELVVARATTLPPARFSQTFKNEQGPHRPLDSFVFAQ